MSGLLFRCGDHAPRSQWGLPRIGGLQAGRKRHYTVDMHCHVLTPKAMAMVVERPEFKELGGQQTRSLPPETVDYNNDVMLKQAYPKLTQLEERFRDMDAMGVDLQVLSPAPNQYNYWADEELAADVVKVINEHIAELVAQHPDRLLGMGTIALQHPELSLRQLDHCVRTLGMKGVEISSTVRGSEIGDPRFAKFWARCEELGCVVFLHPLGTTLGDRVKPFYLSNSLGQPLEHAIALSHLIFGGVLDRHPGLKLFAAHGGGYLASHIGRADHAWRLRPDGHTCMHPPSEYLKRMWFDTIVYRPQALRHLAAEVGVGQLIVGTDYPYDMAHYAMHELVDDVVEFSEADRAAILGGNALGLLGLAPR